jgi:biopolymer transport protein ExbB
MKAIYLGMEYFSKGGPVMWPLLFCSIISVAVILNRIAFFHKADTEKAFTENFCRALRKDHWEEAKNLALATKGGQAALAVRLLEAPEYLQIQEAFVVGESTAILSRFGHGLPYLKVVVTLSPLLGLLGTITGMMSSFAALGDRWENPLAVTSGVSEALITTVFGLSIAIVTICFYAYFSQRMHLITLELELLANTFSEAIARKKEPRS